LDDGVVASFQRSRIHKPHAHTHYFKVNCSTSRSLILNFPTIKEPQTQVDQGSQVKEMMQDNDLKNSKSKDKGSKSRSQSMDEQSHYKQDKTITRQSINVKHHIFNVIGDTKKFEERDLNIGGDCDDRAPGPDGYTFVFFKKGWNIVGQDVCNAVRDFFSNRQLCKKDNHTFLALIPKELMHNYHRNRGPPRYAFKIDI
ncbi:hypothetical protein Tco_1117620, partial [Tanacetum coccineum]